MSNSDLPSYTDHKELPAFRQASPVRLDDCGLAQASNLLGDRWALLILREAFYGVVRFADMQADLGLSKSVLAQRLVRLTEAGLLERFDYREDGERARQGYRLSKRGSDLALVFLAMKQWWDAGQDTPPTARFVTRERNMEVRVALLDENGQEVDPSGLQLRLD